MEKIHQYCQSHLPQMLQLAQEITNCDSHPDDVQGIATVAKLLANQMQKLGMTSQLINANHPGTVLVGQLTGTIPGSSAILLGHMDTVFPPGTTAKRPFATKGPQILGPGVFDMKAGLVIGFLALQALDDLQLAHCPVKMIIVSDEEKLHMHSNAYELIVNHSQGGAYGFNLEGSPAKTTVSTHNRGGMIVEVTVAGRAAHSGIDPQKGRSAIVELAHQIIQFNQLTRLNQGIHVNCGTIDGGQSENIIPDYARVRLGIRCQNNSQRDLLLGQIQRITKVPTIAGTHTTVKVKTKTDSLEETASVTQLLHQLQKEAENIGYGPIMAVAGGGASDAGILVSHGVPTIDAMGVVGSGAHSSAEQASAQSIVDRAALIASFIVRH